MVGNQGFTEPDLDPATTTSTFFANDEASIQLCAELRIDQYRNYGSKTNPPPECFDLRRSTVLLFFAVTNKSKKDSDLPNISIADIEQRILLIRGHKVLLDADLAELYGVTTGNLTKALRRNTERFPEDFAFRLSLQQFKDLKFHFGRSSNWGGRRNSPYAFTEQGVSMLSSVLRSKQAVEVNIAIMRTFVRLRQMLATHDELSRKLDEMEQRYDEQFRVVFDAIRQLMKPPEPTRRKIGFHSD